MDLRVGRLAAVTAVAPHASAGDRGDHPRTVHAANAVVPRVGDVEVARRVHPHAHWSGEFRVGGRAAVPAEAQGTSACQRCDHARRVHAANAVVPRVGDVEVARRVHPHAAGKIKLCAGCRATVPAPAPLARTRHRGDHPRTVHAANAVVPRVGDVEVTRCVHRHAGGVPEQRAGRRAAVPTVAPDVRARDRRDHARRVHLAHAVVRGVCDVEVARHVHRYALWVGEFRVGGRAAVPAEAQGTSACHGCDHARCVHLAHAVVRGVGDVEVARRVHRHAAGVPEQRAGRRAAVPAVAPDVRARDRRDHARRVHLAHAVVRAVGDVKVARRVHRHTARESESRPRGRFVVTDKKLPVAGNRDDNARLRAGRAGPNLRH